jgi:non-heme chloroperoxidase
MKVRWLRSLLIAIPVLLGLCVAAAAQTVPGTQSRFFTTSDGVRLHYLEAGPPGGHLIVFVPGWTMPAWIWKPQLLAFDPRYHVIAFDPRGQGASEIPESGYTPERRGRDIDELLARFAPRHALVVGWSLGVLDTLAAIHVAGDSRLAGLVLVDNSVGEEPPPPPPPRHPRHPRRGPRLTHEAYMQGFVRSMFRTPQSPLYLRELTEATLRTPEFAAHALLSYPVPRTYWRQAVYATQVPVLYIVRPGFAAQAANLQRNRPDTETVVFNNAGHALFVDDAARFNQLMLAFIRRHVWP